MNTILPIIFLLLSGGLFFSYIDGTYTKIKELESQKTTYNNALTSAKEARKEFNKLQDQYNSIPPEEVEQIRRFLPDNIDNIRLVIEINNIALRHGMAIKGVKVDASNNTSTTESQTNTTSSNEINSVGINTVGVSFSVTGTYETFLAFLKDVEKSMRLVDVTAINVVAPPPGKSISDYGVSVKTYWLK